MLGFLRRLRGGGGAAEEVRLEARLAQARRVHDLAETFKAAKSEEARQVVSWAESVTNVYGALLAEGGQGPRDVSELPCAPEEVGLALKVMMIFKLHPDHSPDMEALKHGYLELSRFLPRPGLPDQPDQPDRPDRPDLPDLPDQPGMAVPAGRQEPVAPADSDDLMARDRAARQAELKRFLR